jgi:hypothetical protein
LSNCQNWVENMVQVLNIPGWEAKIAHIPRP